MGTLRVEPKVKSMDPGRYKELREILLEAFKLSPDSHVFYDLEKGESINEMRRDFSFVAEKEGVDLKIRRTHGSDALKLVFSGKAPTKSGRIDPADSRQRIVDVLKEAGRSMKKSEILEASGINRGAWNVRIRELVESGEVARSGERRDTIYTLAKAKRG